MSTTKTNQPRLTAAQRRLVEEIKTKGCVIRYGQNGKTIEKLADMGIIRYADITETNRIRNTPGNMMSSYVLAD